MPSPSDFTLTITIDSAGLDTIYAAGQNVTLALLVESFVEVSAAKHAAAAAGAVCGVAWQSFAPLASNSVSWAGNCYLFATTTPLTVNQVIAINSSTAGPAAAGWIYRFAEGQFSGAAATGAAVYLVNEMHGGSCSFGLAQAATVNGSTGPPAPLCATPVLYNETAQFQLGSLAAIFLSSASANGTVMPPLLPSNALTMTPVAGETLAIGFNDSTNTFYLQPAAA